MVDLISATLALVVVIACIYLLWSKEDKMSYLHLHRKDDPDTSREAAAAQTAPKRAQLQAMILTWARVRGDFTDRDLEQDFPMVPGSSLRTRRSELVRLGRIYDTGSRTKPAGSRRRMILWRAAKDA